VRVSAGRDARCQWLRHESVSRCDRIGNHDHQDALDLARRHPELLAATVAAGYLTHQTGNDGHPANIELTPDVAFSLGLTTHAPAPSTARTPVHAPGAGHL
jgi:hypothetical protein